MPGKDGEGQVSFLRDLMVKGWEGSRWQCKVMRTLKCGSVCVTQRGLCVSLGWSGEGSQSVELWSSVFKDRQPFTQQRKPCSKVEDDIEVMELYTGLRVTSLLSVTQYLCCLGHTLTIGSQRSQPEDSLKSQALKIPFLQLLVTFIPLFSSVSSELKRS